MPHRVMTWMTAAGRPRRFHGVQAWIFAAVVLLVALATMALIGQIIGKVLSMGPLYIALVVITCWAGRGPAMAALVLSAASVCAVVMATVEHGLRLSVASQVSLLLYLLSGAIIVAVCGQLTRTRDAARLTERQLRDKEARLELAIEGARMGTWLTDEARGQAFWDAHFMRLMGVEPGESVAPGNALWLERVHPDDRAEALRALRAARQVAGNFELQVRVGAAPWTQVRWLSIHGRFFGAPGDATMRSIGIAIDVTDSKTLSLALQQADRRKDAFLATLAHELRNPLAPIRYAVKLLQPGVSAATLSHATATIDRQSAQMASLLDDLLDMSRITRDAIELKPAVLDLRGAVSEAVDAVRPVIEEQHHRLGISQPGEAVWISADPIRLAQVLGNLLHNAIKYTDPGGEIEVRVDVHESQARVRISDSGIGIAPADQAQVFEMFTRVSKSADSSRQGLGIGLAIARRLAELHGGRIELQSDGLGQGAQFSIHWPIASAPRSAGDTVVVPITAAPRRPVLVADDNVDATDTLATFLRLQGHRVHTAYDGERALEMAERLRPGLVVLDVGMPGMTGHEVARAIRARPWGAGVTLVAVTGWGQEEDRRQTAEAGFDLHFTKPVDPDALSQALRGNTNAATATQSSGVTN
jgi:signal transduction histidine kinase/CheY-like chemotaxis protein